ncbi:MAG: rRNA maturation RNase YbeY [Deltaproteobacteria bacterium]|nr:rRNA maturation RNase YbeY [Deltaproteobacteria bacterium]
MSRNSGGDTFAAVSVEITGRSGVKKISRRGLKRSARRILEILGQGRAELSLALVDNREMQKLNARYRDKNEPTDVLAFPAGKALLPGMQVLGDVVISVEKAEEQARKRRKTLGQEIRTLL